MNQRFTIPKLRWVIAFLLFAVTLINYVDRQAISILVGQIRESLHLTENDYWHIITLFLVAYAIMYSVSGYVIDKVGTKMGMALFVCFWSISQILHGLAMNKWSFAACRFGLGLAEPGSFPAAVKAIGEWFPVRQRALGVGFFNAGSSLGTAVAAPLVAGIALRFGWRAAFVFTGACGIIWVLAWLCIYESPRKNRWLSESEAAEVSEPSLSACPSPAGAGEGGPAMRDRVRASGEKLNVAERDEVRENVSHPAPAQNQSEPNFLSRAVIGEPAVKISWWKTISSRPGLMVMIPRFFTDPVIYFVIFGLPDYLEKDRGFSLVMIRNYAWIPFAFGGIGYLIGGWLSGRLIEKGWAIGKSRKTVMTIGALFLPVAILAPLVPSSGLALTAMSFVVFGHALWVANLMTLPADLFPPGAVGSAAGFSGTGGAIGGALASAFIGQIVSHFSYTPIFICAGLMHPLSALLVWLLLPERYFAAKHK